MHSNFEITLEFIRFDLPRYTFRLAFHGSAERWLLPYPEVTGLQFTNSNAKLESQWLTRFLISEPGDEFVLKPDARIAFDLIAHINVEANSNITPRWTIELPPGELSAQYVYTVDADMERYDYLAKRSRFAALTKPWGGVVQSNSVVMTVPDGTSSREARTNF